MSPRDEIERVLERLSAAQVEALAAATESCVSLAGALAGAKPGAYDAVSALSAAWSQTEGLTGPGVALALRVGLRARIAADAARASAVWTGPGATGERRLTASVLHELIAGARRRVLVISFAAHTLPSVACDLEAAVEAGCSVDVVFETEVDSSGAYGTRERCPFGDVPGIRRWRWPPDRRSHGSVLHAKALVVDGERALVGSANLTQRALSANLEVGVLVRDETVAAAIEEHVRGLMRSGVLVAVDDPWPKPRAVRG